MLKVTTSGERPTILRSLNLIFESTGTEMGDSVGIEILLEPLFKMLDILATAGQSLVGDLPDSI